MRDVGRMRRGPLLALACVVFLLLCGQQGKPVSAQQRGSLRLSSSAWNITLGTQGLSAQAAARACQRDPNLPGPGVLMPATLLLSVITDIVSKNVGVLTANLLDDPAGYSSGGSSVWVLCPFGGCRAVVFPSKLQSYVGSVELTAAPCSWTLRYICMEYKALEQLSAQMPVPYNRYWTLSYPPLPPPVPVPWAPAVVEGRVGTPPSPPSPRMSPSRPRSPRTPRGGRNLPFMPPPSPFPPLEPSPPSPVPPSPPAASLPAGYRLAVSGVRLGAVAVPDGAVRFSGLDRFLVQGPVVNFVGRWLVGGLDALRVVYAGDSQDVVTQVLANLDSAVARGGYFGDTVLPGSGASWSTTPLPPEERSVLSLRTSYITRVEGCNGHNAIARLTLQTASGARYSQGRGNCLGFFMEEAPRGGYLATVEGYFIRRQGAAQPPNSTIDWTAAAGPSIVQMWLVWCVPANVTTGSPSDLGSLFTTGGLRVVAPRTAPVVPQPQCSSARPLIPADVGPGRWAGRAECGAFSDAKYACPSYLCCSTARGRLGMCGSQASQCLLSCDPGYGLCGLVPSSSQELSLHEGMDFLTPQWQTGSTGSGRPGGSTRPSSNSSSSTPGAAPPAGGAPPSRTPPPPGGRGSGNGSSSGPLAPVGPVEPLFPPTPMSPPATVDLGGPDAPVTTTPVRMGRYLYVLDKSPNLPYRDAVASCRNRTLLSLSWQMIDLTDAVAFESSLLVRSNLLELLSSRVMWVAPCPGSAPCVRGMSTLGLGVTWSVDSGQVRVLQVQVGDRMVTGASVMCKAAWPEPSSSARQQTPPAPPLPSPPPPPPSPFPPLPASRNSSNATSPPRANGTVPSGSAPGGQPPDAPPPAPPPQFTPGPHLLTFSLVGAGSPNSGPSCANDNLRAILTGPDRDAWDAWVAAVAAGNATDDDGRPASLDDWSQPVTVLAQLAGVALRPMVLWSTMATEQPSSYEAVSAAAMQYYMPPPPTPPPPSPLLPLQPAAPPDVSVQGEADGSGDGSGGSNATGDVNVLPAVTTPASSPVYGSSVDLTAAPDSGLRQDTSPLGPYRMLPAPPVVLGSLDGTYLSPNRSYGVSAPPAYATSLSYYVSATAGWRWLQLNVSAGEVVVEAAGCRGSLLEGMVLRTSTGRLWSYPSARLVCSEPWRYVAPAGGYLLAMQATAGSYIEELLLVWGTPVKPPPAPPAPSPSPQPPFAPYEPPATVVTAVNVAPSKRQTRVIVGASVAVAVALLLVTGCTLLYCGRVHGWYCWAGGAAAAAAAAAGKKAAAKDGSPDAGSFSGEVSADGGPCGSDGRTPSGDTGDRGSGGAAAAGVEVTSALRGGGGGGGALELVVVAAQGPSLGAASGAEGGTAPTSADSRSASHSSTGGHTASILSTSPLMFGYVRRAASGNRMRAAPGPAAGQGPSSSSGRGGGSDMGFGTAGSGEPLRALSVSEVGPLLEEGCDGAAAAAAVTAAGGGGGVTQHWLTPSALALLGASGDSPDGGSGSGEELQAAYLAAVAAAAAAGEDDSGSQASAPSPTLSEIARVAAAAAASAQRQQHSQQLYHPHSSHLLGVRQGHGQGHTLGHGAQGRPSRAVSMRSIGGGSAASRESLHSVAEEVAEGGAGITAFGAGAGRSGVRRPGDGRAPRRHVASASGEAGSTDGRRLQYDGPLMTVGSEPLDVSRSLGGLGGAGGAGIAPRGSAPTVRGCASFGGLGQVAAVVAGGAVQRMKNGVVVRSDGGSGTETGTGTGTGTGSGGLERERDRGRVGHHHQQLRLDREEELRHAAIFQKAIHNWPPSSGSLSGATAHPHAHTNASLPRAGSSRSALAPIPAGAPLTPPLPALHAHAHPHSHLPVDAQARVHGSRGVPSGPGQGQGLGLAPSGQVTRLSSHSSVGATAGPTSAHTSTLESSCESGRRATKAFSDTADTNGTACSAYGMNCLSSVQLGPPPGGAAGTLEEGPLAAVMAAAAGGMQRHRPPGVLPMPSLSGTASSEGQVSPGSVSYASTKTAAAGQRPAAAAATVTRSGRHLQPPGSNRSSNSGTGTGVGTPPPASPGSGLGRTAAAAGGAGTPGRAAGPSSRHSEGPAPASNANTNANTNTSSRTAHTARTSHTNINTNTNTATGSGTGRTKRASSGMQLHNTTHTNTRTSTRSHTDTHTHTSTGTHTDTGTGSGLAPVPSSPLLISPSDSTANATGGVNGGSGDSRSESTSPCGPAPSGGPASSTNVDSSHAAGGGGGAGAGAGEAGGHRGGGAVELLLGRDVLVDVDDPSTYLGHGTSGVVRRGLLRQLPGAAAPSSGVSAEGEGSGASDEGGVAWMHVAVKLLNSPPGDQNAHAHKKHLRTLVQEITILGSLRHPNIVRLLGGSLQPGASFLVEELCGMTLSHAIYNDSTPYGLVTVLRWCCDIARGLAYLHPNIMHRDLKPSNVLLDEAGTAKISDFGLARFKAHTTLNTRDAEVGTTYYMSPECFVSADVKVTAACDVYSLGVMMNEMATRTRPWSGVRSAVVGFKVAVVGHRPKMADPADPLCPPPLRRLIQDCWAQQPEARPTSGQVLARLEELLAQVEAQGGAWQG